MSATFGSKVRITIFGQSHSSSIGAVLDGIPAGIHIDPESLNEFMKRRSPGKELSTKRKEDDLVDIVSGLNEKGFTCGAPICFLIKNKDVKSSDYEKLKNVPRPSHADFAAYMKFGDSYDCRGGGQFSGRLTAPLCAAGYVCKTLLEQKGIHIVSHIAQIYDIKDEPLDEKEFSSETAEKLKSDFPVINDTKKAEMAKVIKTSAEKGDSVGGIVECGIYGLKPGLGDSFFGNIESTISQIIFAIPAVKGIEFGKGFGFSAMFGSEANDQFITDGKDIKTTTNNCGGILGGISSGMPIIFRTAFKPTPSIFLPQKSVNIKDKTAVELTIHGRHDPCIVLRTPPVCEAAAALAIINLIGEIQ